MDKIKRLQWQCRRGMLEVDLVVKRYLTEDFAQAKDAEQACFEDLLRENDQNLFDWLTGKSQPEEKYVALITKMRRL